MVEVKLLIYRFRKLAFRPSFLVRGLNASHQIMVMNKLLYGERL